MKDYGHILDDRPARASSPPRSSTSTSCWRREEPQAVRKPIELRAAYHDACHLAHAQEVRRSRASCCAASPAWSCSSRAEWELCCGSAGIYNLLQPEAAAQARRAQGGEPARDRRRGDRRRQPGLRAADRQAPRPPDLSPDDPARHVPPRSEAVSKVQAAAPPDDAARRRSCPTRRWPSSASCRSASAPRRAELLQARAERGAPSGFLEETEEIRDGDWQVPPPRPDYEDRRVEITGPTDRKLVINALNSGAKGFMADFEDANSPDLAQPGRGPPEPDRRDRGHDHLRRRRRPPLRADRQPGDAARPPARLAPAREAPDDRRRAGRGRVHGLRPLRVPLRQAARASATAGSTSTCRRWSTTRRRALWNDVFTFTREALGAAAGADPRHGADRDAARRVPDGRDHPRARRALLRAQRRPLGLHLLDDQGLPRRPGLRAARTATT